MKVGIKVLILTVDPGPLSSAGVFLYKHEALRLSVEIVPNLRGSRPVLVIEPVDSHFCYLLVHLGIGDVGEPFTISYIST